MRKVIQYIICKCGFFFNKTEITGLILPTDLLILKQISRSNYSKIKYFLKLKFVFLHILHFYEGHIFNLLHVAPIEVLRYT